MVITSWEQAAAAQSLVPSDGDLEGKWSAAQVT